MDRFEPQHIQTGKPALIDVPVLLEFFIRPDYFSLVFEQVRIARPSVVLLYQDGIREGKNDEEGHASCRKIAEGIDWDCTVYRYYQEKNMGCDPSGFMAQRWAFSLVEKCIVLEDDCVPSQAFFPFCRELLSRYENDDRINIICGMNNKEKWDSCKDSYFFSLRGSIWGWASWRRVVMDWKEDYDWVYDKAQVRQLRKAWNPCRNFSGLQKRWRQCASKNKPYFEVLLGERLLRSNSLNIVPKYNLIANVGLRNGTHSDNELCMIPGFYRSLFTLKVYEEIPLPLKHPQTVERDVRYDRVVDPNWFQQLMLRPERIFLRLRYGEGSASQVGVLN